MQTTPPIPIIESQLSSHKDSYIGTWHHDDIIDALNSLVELAENTQQAQDWLNKLLYWNSVINFSSHADQLSKAHFFEMRHLHLLQNIPSNGIHIQPHSTSPYTPPYNVVYGILKILFPSYAFIDSLSVLYSVMISYPCSGEKYKLSGIRYELSSQMHAGRALRGLLQSTILGKLEELSSIQQPRFLKKDPCVAQSINDFFDIYQWESMEHPVQPFIQTLCMHYFSDSEDITYYHSLLHNPKSSLSQQLYTARAYFGTNNTPAWANFSHLMLMDPELLLRHAPPDLEHDHPFHNLLAVSRLFITYDETHPIYMSQNADNRPILDYLRTKPHAFLPSQPSSHLLPTAFLAMARTRFLAVLTTYWHTLLVTPPTSMYLTNMKTYTDVFTSHWDAFLTTPPMSMSLTNIQTYTDVFTAIAATKPAALPEKHMLLLYKYTTQQNAAHPSSEKRERAFSFFLKKASRILENIKNFFYCLYDFFFPALHTRPTPEERYAYISSLELSEDAYKDYITHGLIDIDVPKDYFECLRVKPRMRSSTGEIPSSYRTHNPIHDGYAPKTRGSLCDT